MIDHIGFAVTDFQRSRAFFTQALAPLSVRPVMEVTAEETGNAAHAGFGTDQKPFFWISSGGRAGPGVHVALHAGSRAAVDAFFAAAIAAGGRDNGGPGLRPHYHPNYYAAFVLDPDGNNIEAVCHSPG
ncbi:glyoxalase [Allostella vacuolata]|nr:glyoxalase [Stella vacuolata]